MKLRSALVAVSLVHLSARAQVAPAKPWPLAALPVPHWQAASQIYVPSDNSKDQMVILANSYVGGAHNIPVDGTWYAIDLTPMGVHASTKAVFLSGRLIITNDNNPGIADLWIALRAPGSKLACDHYIGQTMEPFPGGGQRSTMSGWFPVVNGVIEVCITALKGSAGVVPHKIVPAPNTLPSYGVNLSLQAQAL